MSETTPTTTYDPVACRATPEEEERLARLMADAPASVGALFLDRVAWTPDREAFRGPDGDGGWSSHTWAGTAEVVFEVAAGLVAQGLEPQDRVALASATRLEWVHADLGVMCAGGATSTIYPTSTPEDVLFILQDCGARIAVVEDPAQLAKVTAEPSATPDLRLVVLMTGEAGTAPAGEAGGSTEGDAAAVPVLTWEQLRASGRTLLAEQPDVVRRRTAAVEPHHLATLIYTSGTTGRPKGVRLPHRCWVYEGLATAAVDALRPDDVAYLWLPLSHSFGKVLLTGQIAVGHVSAVDGDVDHIVSNLPVVRPDGMAGAPRVYEKVYARVSSTVEAEGGVKAKIFAWAFGVGREVSRLRAVGEEPTGLLAAKFRLADRLVFAKIRERFGGRVRYFISGAAPLSRDIAEWFDAAGLRILEGYGLTETSAASFVNRPDRYEFGTVGVPLPGTEVALDHDGEILLRGPGVMEGYHHLPDETAAVMTPDGWFRTGDIGEVTSAGFLRITDRKKDLIKTSGGKYVAPQTIETRFKALCPLVSQIVVHGDGRNFVTALLSLDPDAVAAWAQAHGQGDRPYAEVVTSPEMRRTVEGYVDELNAGLGRWETVKRFTILDHDLTVEDGHLTPSMKLKRRHVERRYADVLDAHYTEGR